MAAYIGVRGYQTISATMAKGYQTYGRAYRMYAVMMTCSGLAHCIVPSSTSVWFNFWVTYLDLVLTSSIAFHFGLAALVDLGMDEAGKALRAGLYSGETAIAGLWFYYGFLAPSGLAFWYLYFGLIAVCCGFYVFAQLYLLARNGFRGFASFALGAAAGGIGLYCMLNRQLMCNLFGANFGASFWWDALSNQAMVALAVYYLTSRDLPALQAESDHFDLESQTEQDELPPAYQDAIAAPTGAAHPQIVYIPLQVYPGRED